MQVPQRLSGGPDSDLECEELPGTPGQPEFFKLPDRAQEHDSCGEIKPRDRKFTRNPETVEIPRIFFLEFRNHFRRRRFMHRQIVAVIFMEFQFAVSAVWNIRRGECHNGKSSSESVKRSS